jgi:uncharacterized membrane-anchored protein
MRCLYGKMSFRCYYKKKVKAVINAVSSASGKYPNRGPKILINAGIPIIDNIGLNHSSHHLMRGFT